MTQCPRCQQIFRHPPQYVDHQIVCGYLPNLPEPPTTTTTTTTTPTPDTTTYDPTLLPSPPEMFRLITHLIREVEQLKTTLARQPPLTHHHPTKRTPQILATTPSPPTVFQDWIKGFRVSQAQLERVFQFDIMEGIKRCISDRITTEGITHIPVRSSPTRRHVLYMYNHDTTDTTETPSRPRWVVCDPDDMMVMIDQITLQFDIAFCDWDEVNRTRMQKTQDDKDRYNLYMLKVEGKDFRRHRDRYRNELRNWLCEKVVYSTPTTG